MAACMEHQTQRTHGPSQHDEEGRSAQEARESALAPFPAHRRAHLTAPLMLMDLSWYMTSTGV